MSVFTWTNNAVTTLAAGITTTSTTLSLTSGSGALFPNPATGNYFSLTLQSASNSSIVEIVYCTARSGDTLTVIRAQEGTSATAFNAGDNASLLLTAGQLNGLVQIPHMTDATIAPVFSNTQVQGTLSTTGAATIGGQATVNGNVTANNGNGYFNNLIFAKNNCEIQGPDTNGVLRTMMTLDAGNNVDVWTGPAYFRVLRYSDGAGLATVDNSGNGVFAGGVTANGNVAATGAYLRAGLGATNNPGDPNAAAINNDFQISVSGGAFWYTQPLSNGQLFMQGGTNVLGVGNVNFPKPFPHACLSVVCCEGAAQTSTWGTSGPSAHGVGGFTNTYWVHWGMQWNGSTWVQATLTTCWYAIGY